MTCDMTHDLTDDMAHDMVHGHTDTWTHGYMDTWIHDMTCEALFFFSNRSFSLSPLSRVTRAHLSDLRQSSKNFGTSAGRSAQKGCSWCTSYISRKSPRRVSFKIPHCTGEGGQLS